MMPTATPPANEAALTAFKALVERRLGLALRPEDDRHHAALLVEFAALRGHGPPRALDEPSASELGWLADRLTVNETFFFRNTEHFAALTELVLPELLGRARAEQRPVRALSAGCASGEEAYSLAIALEALGAAPHEISITGVDVSPAVIERARRARFSAWSLRATPDETRARYFARAGEQWVLASRVAERVSFELGNLVAGTGTFWTAGPYDLILCRNVLMYFPIATMSQVVERLERALRDGGYLFLGHAESLRATASALPPGDGPRAPTSLRVLSSHEAFFYQKGPVLGAGPGLFVLEPARVDAAEAVDPAWFDHIGQQGQKIAKLHADAVRRDAESHSRRTAEHPPRAPLANAPRERIAAAVAALDTGRFDELLRLCAELTEEPDAHYLLALHREHLGDTEGAIAHCQIAASLDPDFAMPRVHLGIMLARLGDKEAARRAFAEAMKRLEGEREERLVWFGGGFSREGLRDHCAQMSRSEGVRHG